MGALRSLICGLYRRPSDPHRTRCVAKRREFGMISTVPGNLEFGVYSTVPGAGCREFGMTTYTYSLRQGGQLKSRPLNAQGREAIPTRLCPEGPEAMGKLVDTGLSSQYVYTHV